MGPGGLGALAVAGFLGLPVAAAPDFPLDDAWIHLDYARGLIREGTFSYNPGEPEAGFSSPLWVLAETPVLAVCDALGVSPVMPVKALSLAFGVLAAWALARWVGALGGGPLARGAAGWLLWSSPAWTFASLSGMEATLFATLILLALDRTTRCPGWGAGVLWALALWARPEAVVPGALALGWALWRHPRGPTLRMLLPPVAAGLVWAAWCLGVSGHPFPNTYAVKAFSGGGIGDSVAHLRRVFLAGEGPFRTALVALTALWGLRSVVREPARREPALVPMLAVLVSLGVVMDTHPLSPAVRFFHTRYLLPFLVPLLAFGALGAEDLARRLRSPGARWGLTAALALGVLAASWTGWRDQRQSYRGHCREVREAHTLPALAVKAMLPAGATVATEAAGSLRFHLPPDRQVLDLLGLNDHRIAWSAGDPEARSCYILGRRPDLLLIPESWRDRLDPGFDQQEVARWETGVWTSGDGTGIRRVVLFRATPRPQAWEYCRQRYGGSGAIGPAGPGEAR